MGKKNNGLVVLKGGPFWLGGCQWEVDFVPHVILEHTALEDEGCCIHSKQLILIGTQGRCMDRIRSTLLHELLHAAIGITMVMPMDEERTEELVVEILESRLYDLLRNPKNSWIWEFLHGE